MAVMSLCTGLRFSLCDIQVEIAALMKISECNENYPWPKASKTTNVQKYLVTNGQHSLAVMGWILCGAIWLNPPLNSQAHLS